MRRPSSVSDLWCPVGPRERVACDDIKAALALDSDANLMRTALYNLAVHALGAGHVDTDLFRLHSYRGKRSARRSRAPKQLPLKVTA